MSLFPLQKLGDKPQIWKIIDKGGSKFWTAQNGAVFSKDGTHQVVVVGGRIYDAITGCGGMLVADYQKMLIDIGLREPWWAQIR